MNDNSNKKIRIILTGATGMVGEGVLHECLQHQMVEEVLSVVRRPCGITHPKLKEVIHDNFLDFSPIEDELKGYDSCFFCLGVSSVGMKELEYYKLTYTMTMGFALIVSALNPQMTFCYVSGAGTDGSEKGRLGWARIKGKTENDLMKLPFKQVFNYRPGFLNPTAGLKNTHKYYKYFLWMYPFMRRFLPGYVSTLKELGLSMINVALNGYEKNVLEVKDIVRSSTSG